MVILNSLLSSDHITAGDNETQSVPPTHRYCCSVNSAVTLVLSNSPLAINCASWTIKTRPKLLSERV